MVKIENIIPNIAKSTAEGPVWMEGINSLFFVDTYGGDFNFWNAETKTIDIVHYDDFATFAVPHANGGYVGGVGKKLYHFTIEDPTNFKVLCEVDQGKQTRIVDGKCDSRGRVFFATMGLESKPAVPVLEQACLYSLDTDGTVVCHDDGMHIANSMVWSPDETKLYLTESIPGFIYQYDYDINTGKTSNRKIVCYLPHTEHGIVDRMAVDTEGFLWNCYYRGGKATRIDPKTGEIVRTIKMPTSTVTCVCFGGKKYDELYISSSIYEQDLTVNPHAGSVFRVSGTGCKGFAPNPYRGK